MGGGKGGIGKSLLTASLGWQLARMGKRVVLVDADLGGANLHTCMGLPTPERSLGDFIQRRCEKIEDVVVETGTPGLRLVSGASDFLGAANIKYTQKMRVLNRIKALDVDMILLDLGAGTSFNIIDFFLISDLSVLTVVPEPTSIENGYRFIKSALYRRLRSAAPREGVRLVIDAALDPKNPLGIRTPLDLLAHVQKEDPEAVEILKKEMAAFSPALHPEPGARQRGHPDRASARGRLRPPPGGAGQLRGLPPLRRLRLAVGAPAEALHGGRAHLAAGGRGAAARARPPQGREPVPALGMTEADVAAGRGSLPGSRA